MLQTELQGAIDSDTLALVDSGTNYNFTLWHLVNKLGWRLHKQAPLEVRLANRDRLASLGAVCGLVQCGKWQAHVYFLVLDLMFDLVLGMPWLMVANLRMDWAQKTIMV